MQEMILSIIKDISGFFETYAPAGFLLALLVTFFYWRSLTADRGLVSQAEHFDAGMRAAEQPDKSIEKRGGLFFLLIWYFYIVLGITILSRTESGTRKASFELFRTFQNTFYAKKQIYANVIMFVPLAMLLYGLDSRFRKVWMAVVVGVLGSFIIEVTQWMTKTGCFELDDILTNTLGMLLGFVACVMVEKFIMRKKKRRNAT